METVSDFIFCGSKITADGGCSHEVTWDFSNKGHDAHACSGQAHLLSEQSWDHLMRKRAGLKIKRTCI